MMSRNNQKHFHTRLALGLVCILCTLTMHAIGQQKLVLGARHEFFAMVGPAIPLGAKVVDGQSTMLANMKSGLAVSAGMLRTYKKNWVVGAELASTQFSNWNQGGDRWLVNSRATIYSAGPTVGFHSWSNSSRLRNKFSFAVMGTVGFARMQLITAAESAINAGAESLPALSLTTGKLLLKASLVATHHISHHLAAVGTVSYSHMGSGSAVLSDLSYSSLTIQLGLAYRFTLDHEYKFHLN